ncbi:MAG: hypothetical protein ACI8Z1_000240 [Candidatus Azotimanducaceae bacterium]|jgi:hypothetical protein
MQITKYTRKTMKITAWIIGILIGLVLTMAGLERLAAERIEVVELHTLDEQSQPVTTRLWIVDSHGYQYLRVGSDGSGWFDRVNANKAIDLTRNDDRQTYTVMLRPEKSEEINRLMHEKYTWGDSLIGQLVGGRDQSIPIELHRVE